MAKRGKSEEERRRTPRATCRLHCRVAKGREYIRARIIDVSEGGLCLISPVWLKPKDAIEIAIDVPGTGLSKVRVEIWHINRQKSRSSNSRVWIAGAMLVDADKAYGKLLSAAGVAPLKVEVDGAAKPESSTRAGSVATRTESGAKSTGGNGTQSASTKAPSESTESIDALEPKIFRIRCKARGGPRSRILTLAADSEEEARSLATRDLGDTWSVLEIREA